LRTNESKELWRTIAIVVGMIFLVRYFCHAKEYLIEAAHEKFRSTANNNNYDDNDSLELAVEDDFMERTMNGEAAHLKQPDDDDVEQIDTTGDDDDESVTLIGNNNYDNNNIEPVVAPSEQLQEVV
jgi:hypothetical protein